MSHEPLSPWPRFGVTHLAGEDLPPDLARQFPQLPVPSEGITGLVAGERLTLVTAPDGTELIQLTEAAADALRAQLEPIDPAAWFVHGYWDTFYRDVAIGDYSPDQFAPPPPPA